MNLGQMTTEVALALGNMSSTHPWYTFIGGSASLPGYISRAANKLVRMTAGANGQNLDIFPELKNSWTVGPTVASTNTVAKPSDCIVVQYVNRAESSTLPDWNVTQEKPLGNPIDWRAFGLLAKDSTTAGYARIWSRKGRNILIHPTPTSSYLDYLRFYGLKSESALVNSTDTLFMDEQWHDLVVTLTCYGIAMRMGWKDDAANFMAQVQQEIGQTTDVTAVQNDEIEMMVKDAPTQLSVYGE